MRSTKKNFCRVSGSADIGRSKGCQKCSSRFLSRLDEDEKKEVEPKRKDEKEEEEEGKSC